MMRKHFKLLTALSALATVLMLCCVSASAATVAPRTPASAAARGHAGSSSAEFATRSAEFAASAASLGSATPTTVKCPAMWCIFHNTDYVGPGCSGQVSNPNLEFCRNADESVENGIALCGPPPNNKCAVRIYYHPLNIDGGGAHACIPYGVDIPNLSGYTFNSGPGEPGYGQPIWNNAGGLTISNSACSNPI
jgi:hypothetical protein